MKIIWTNSALNDINLSISYIAKSSPKNAHKVLITIKELVNALDTFPYAYPIEPVFNKDDVRFIAKWNFKIIYRITKNQIQILRIFNTKQSPEKLQ